MLYALLDTLPSGANVFRWYKKVGSSVCSRCGKYQTLHHILANCVPSLPLYTIRHNAVLILLLSFLVLGLSEGWSVFVDLPDNPNSYSVFPDFLAVSSQRPDLIILNRITRTVILGELTVPADIGMAAAVTRKQERYDDPKDAYSLVKRLRRNDWKASLITIEVGALGSLPKHCLKPFTNLVTSDKAKKNALLLAVSSTALEESCNIFHKSLA
eukprot:Lithocolla_globosa_v1_NODE_2053_length_2189_cov_36.674321.p2 type:complete len:213 gc:universal NODE_2053_length_2189_cov_36.674321:1519-2157(+)